MIAIVDSGATKAAWVLVNQQQQIVETCATKGFSPLHHSSQQIIAAVRAEDTLKKYDRAIQHLYYFGAGCSSAERCLLMKNSLQVCFPNAQIQVEHDLLAAVLATCGREKGISCILGTGSNACYYDGKNIHQSTPSLDYILGDEGSGSHLGKRLITDFLYHRVPKPIAKELSEKYRLDKELVLKRVYQEPNGKPFLASFAQLLTTYKQEPYVQQLIYQSFDEFVDIHVCSYVQHQILPIHFIGSVAHHHQDVLRAVCTKRQVQLGKVIQKPIDNLVEYMIKEHFEELRINDNHL